MTMRVIAWGLGVCSTTMAVMSVLGDLPPVDLVLNCDPGWERRRTYEIGEWYLRWFEKRGVSAECMRTGDIRKDSAAEHIHVPFWTESGGPLRRQCTRQYKIAPARRRLRALLGFQPSSPPAPPAGAVDNWVGFTLDEWHRMKQSPVAYITNVFPLVDVKMTRADCVRYLHARGLPVPPKSACVCCPYRSASEWLELRDEEPETWEAAVQFDRENRANPLAARGNSTADRLYLYRGGVPLEEADLEADAAAERELVWFQLPLICGDGACWT